MAIGNEDIVSGFNVIAKIGDMIMAQTEFLSFSFDIKMNEAPKGELVVLDRNSIAITGNEVGNYITFEFNHVATDRTEKSSSMICIIDDIDQCTGLGEHSAYRIQFSAGNVDLLERKNTAYSGTSVNAIQSVFNSYNGWWSSSLVFNSQNIPMSDSCTWRCISMNMWEQMRYIASKSFRENDYLFWYWDDVGDAISVSSLLTAKQQDTSYYMIQNTNAIGQSDQVKMVNENPSATVWLFDTIKRRGFVGANKEQIKPNTSVIANDPDYKTKICGDVRGACFDNTMKSMGDKSQLSQSKVGSFNGAFGQLNVIKPNLNNTNATYAIAEDVRARVLASYGKYVSTLIHNNIGPSLGSLINVICYNTKYNTGDSDILDRKYSDKYIVIEKSITYTAVGQDKLGAPVPATPRLRTVIGMVSDNIYEDGINNIKDVSNDVMGKVNK